MRLSSRPIGDAMVIIGLGLVICGLLVLLIERS